MQRGIRCAFDAKPQSVSFRGWEHLTGSASGRGWWDTQQRRWAKSDEKLLPSPCVCVLPGCAHCMHFVVSFPPSRSPAMGNLIKVLGKDLENCPHFFLDFESKWALGGGVCVPVSLCLKTGEQKNKNKTWINVKSVCAHVCAGVCKRRCSVGGWREGWGLFGWELLMVWWCDFVVIRCSLVPLLATATL